MSEKVLIEDITKYAYVENPRFNPKGDVVAYQLAHADVKNNTYKRDIWIVRNGKASQLTSTIDASIVAWEDDDTLILRRNTETTEPLTTDLYKININGGEALKFVTLPIALGTLKKAGENLYVAAATIDMHEPDVYKMSTEDRNEYAKKKKEEAEHYQVVDEVPYWFNGQNFVNGNRTALFVIETEPFKISRITAPAFDADEFILHGDNIVYTGDVRKRRSSLFNKVYSYSLSAKKKETIYGKADYTFRGLFYFGDQLYAQATDHKEFGVNETPKMCKVDKDSVTALFKPEVSYHASAGSDVFLGGGQNHKELDGHFLTIATEDYETVIYDFDKDFHKTVVKPEGVTFNSMDYTSDKIAVSGVTWDHPTELYIMNRDGSDVTRVTSHNDSMVEGRYVAEPQMFQYESTDETLNGWVLLPKDYSPKKKYPAVFDIHGGPRAAYGTGYFHEMQVWASEGYFVFFTNIRGSDGRGDEFADIRGKYGSVDFENLMDFADEVLKRYPAIDEKRVCETGGSYGGFMTNWIIGHTNRFCCAASQRSIANWISKSFMSDIGPYFNPDQCGADGPFDFDALWDHSPLKYAKGAKTPTLFIHSDQDRRCPLPEGMQMMQALALQNVETRLVIFHGENHELSRSGKPQHRVRRLTEITNWFESHAK